MKKSSTIFKKYFLCVIAHHWQTVLWGSITHNKALKNIWGRKKSNQLISQDEKLNQNEERLENFGKAFCLKTSFQRLVKKTNMRFNFWHFCWRLGKNYNVLIFVQMKFNLLKKIYKWKKNLINSRNFWKFKWFFSNSMV